MLSRILGAVAALLTMTALVVAVPGSAHADAVGTPTLGACYDYGYKATVPPTNSAAPVSCSARHTAKTIAVGTLPSGTTADTFESDPVLLAVMQGCETALHKALGVSWAKDDKLAYNFTFYFPTSDEFAAGADWYRCDLNLESPGKVYPLKKRLAYSGDSVARCLVLKAGSGYRTPCTARHDYRAVSTYAVPGGATEPGRNAILRLAAKKCGRAVGGNTWWTTWTNSAEWAAGNHQAVCYRATRH